MSSSFAYDVAVDLFLFAIVVVVFFSGIYITVKIIKYAWTGSW